jgi:putative ABC transport system permease protein
MTHGRALRRGIGQGRTLLAIAVANLWRGKWSSLAIVVCVMLVVVVLMAFLAMARGFDAAAKNAGSEHVGLVLGEQATSEAMSRLTRDQVELLRSAPLSGVAGAATPLSAEFDMTVSAQREEDGSRLNMTLRGLERTGVSLREGFALVEGRAYVSGRSELIVGRGLAARTRSLGTGRRLRLAGRDWTVVGIFTLATPAFESELWADIASVQTAYGRENQFQSVRIPLPDAQALARLREYVANDPRLGLDVQTERQFYRAQARGTSNVMRYLGWPLAAILAIGCLAGVFNTAMIAVHAQRRAIRILHLQGFSSSAIFGSVLFETVALSAIGAALGIALSYAALQGVPTSTVGAGFTTVRYALQVDAGAAAEAVALALAIGVLGGLLPAWRSLTGRSAC